MSDDWKFFVLGHGRTPLPNCSGCDRTQYHDRETCPCLTCHGFYAATNDRETLLEMARRYPHNDWAVRTGRASGIVVLDVEGPVKDPAGFDSIERFPEYAGFHLPEVTLQARTPSGGLHLYFTFPGQLKIGSRNRVLPGVDLKADGGYVVVPTLYSEGRAWDRRGAPTEYGVELANWFTHARGGRPGAPEVAGHSGGYDFNAYLRDGCPGGVRDEFFNDLIFRCRKANMSQEETRAAVEYHWRRCGQPGNHLDASYYMPLAHAAGKIPYVWRNVEPNPRLDPALESWAQQQTMMNGELHKIGRVTFAPKH